MEKWVQRILAAAALIFALSVAGWAVRPRAKAQVAFQLVREGDLTYIFDPRSATLYKMDWKDGPKCRGWYAYCVLPPDVGDKQD